MQQYILMRMNYHITRTQYTLLCLEGNHITSTAQAFRCLEGTTMSNRGQRHRIRTQREASAWRAVRQRIGFRGLPHHLQNGLFLFIALMRMVTFSMKVVHNLSVWALRARSYKTKAEDWAVGHRPPSSSRGLSWFLSCLQQWVQEVRWTQWVQEVQRVPEVQGILLTTVFHISSLHSSSSQYHILIS